MMINKKLFSFYFIIWLKLCTLLAVHCLMEYRQNVFEKSCNNGQPASKEAVLKEVKGRSKLDCHVKCTLAEVCVAAEFDKVTKQCVMFTNVKSNCSTVTTEENGVSRTYKVWSDWCYNGGTPHYNMCTCDPGITGTYCQTYIDECLSGPCSTNGTCTDYVNSYTCTCDLGFTGTHCETDLCDLNPCQNFGTCIRLPGNYNCQCIAGFLGINCQTDDGPVVTSTLAALNGGGRGSWRAADYCPTGTYAVAFQLKVENCCSLDDTAVNGVKLTCKSPHTASPSGTISSTTEQWGSWKAVLYCSTNFFITGYRLKGMYDTWDPMGTTNSDVKCRGQGVTESRQNVFKKSCNNGHPTSKEAVLKEIKGRSKLDCHVKCTLAEACVAAEFNKVTKQCVMFTNVKSNCSAVTTEQNTVSRTYKVWSDWCYNDGTPHYNMCTCDPGVTGTYCQTKIDECLSGPCGTNGTCTDYVNSYGCTCDLGFTGTNCETDLCDPKPCQNYGTCIRLAGNYNCQCIAGFSGINCQTDICDPNPCQNYGTCIRLAGKYNCQCIAGFSGINCQTDHGPVVTSTLAAPDGGGRGIWRDPQYCPTGTYAVAFQLKVEDWSLGDTTGVNGVKLTCKSPHSASTIGTISSTTQKWGSWKAVLYCSTGYFITSYRLKVKDKLGATNSDVQCRGHGVTGTSLQTLSGNGLSEGTWYGWSGQCPSGDMVCGIRTKVQSDQGNFKDDTAVNDYKLYCCDY